MADDDFQDYDNQTVTEEEDFIDKSYDGKEETWQVIALNGVDFLKRFEMVRYA